MQKIYLSILLTGLLWAQAIQPNALIAIGDTLAQAAHHTIAHVDTLEASVAWGAFRHSIANAEEAPEAIRAFCHTICAEHGLIPANINIKINPEEFTAAGIQAFGNNTIIISQHYLAKLTNALTNPELPESREALETMRTFMKHEIKHLKNHDSSKRLAAHVAASAATHAGFALLIPQSLNHRPASFLSLALKSAFLWVTAKLKQVLHRKIVDKYEAYQEQTADDYAFNHSSANALEQTIKTYQNSQQVIVNILAGTQEINPAFPEETLAAIATQQQTLRARYNQSGSTEPYQAWVAAQTADLERAERTFFPGRPLLSTTIRDALAAARRVSTQHCCKGHANHSH